MGLRGTAPGKVKQTARPNSPTQPNGIILLFAKSLGDAAASSIKSTKKSLRADGRIQGP